MILLILQYSTSQVVERDIIVTEPEGVQEFRKKDGRSPQLMVERRESRLTIAALTAFFTRRKREAPHFTFDTEGFVFFPFLTAQIQFPMTEPSCF
jgi:hypothetical protein